MFLRYRSLFLVGGLLLLLAPSTGFAMGISPALVSVENMLPDQTVSKSVQLSRANPYETINATVAVTGEAADAIELTNDGVVELPQGEQIVEYAFTINTEGLTPGNYSAALTVNPVADDEDATTTYVLAGVQGEIQFTVTDEEIASYTIQEIQFSKTGNNQPAEFTYLMVNTGNTATRPAKIDVALTDENNAANSFTETVSSSALPLVPAFQQQSVDVVTSLSLSASLYSTEVTFYSDDTSVVHVADSARLQIVDELISNQNNAWQTILLVVLIVLFISAVASLFWQAKKDHSI